MEWKVKYEMKWEKEETVTGNLPSGSSPLFCCTMDSNKVQI